MRSATPNKQRDDCTWLIYVLTVEGSYLQDTDRPANGAPDTYQCWITPNEVYDVRTYAIDKDVRILRVDYPGHISDPVTYFRQVALETYGDIIGQSYCIDAQAGEPVERLREKLKTLGLHPNVKDTPFGFPLWLPEDAKYWSQSGSRD
jgi:hypothetical protein